LKILTDLELRLGIVVDPCEVRLIPGLEDGYRWSYLDHKAHLFGKQLSKHNVSAYRQLCREVGRSFEAVPTEITVQQKNKDSPTNERCKEGGLDNVSCGAEVQWHVSRRASFLLTIPFSHPGQLGSHTLRRLKPYKKTSCDFRKNWQALTSLCPETKKR
jgi:hypothetical protein